MIIAIDDKDADGIEDNQKNYTITVDAITDTIVDEPINEENSTFIIGMVVIWCIYPIN